jgi:hypothetical protein
VATHDIVRHARTAGALYVVLFVLGPFVFLGGKVGAFVAGDPAATWSQLVALGDGIRHGLAIEVVILLVEVVLAGILYVILRPVHHALAVVAAFSRLGEAIVQAMNLVPGIVLERLRDGSGLAGLEGPARAEVAYLVLDAHRFGILVWGLLFGLHLLALGELVRRSGFLPAWLGLLLRGVDATRWHLAAGR